MDQSLFHKKVPGLNLQLMYHIFLLFTEAQHNDMMSIGVHAKLPKIIHYIKIS